VYCRGQTVGWIKMKLGTQVGLGPGHILLDRDPAPLPQRATAPNFRPICCGQMARWYGGRPRPRRLCVRWGPSCPSPKRGRSPTILGPCLLWSNCWMHQDGICHGCGPKSRPHCVRWGPSSPPPPKKGDTAPPQYSAHVYWGTDPQFSVNVRCTKRLDGLRCHLVWR